MLLVLRTTFDSPTGDSADRCVWSWGLDGPAPDAAAMSTLGTLIEDDLQLAPVFGTHPQAVRDYIQPGYQPLYHEVFDAMGGPALGVIDAVNAQPNAGLASAGPTEVQLVVSRLVSTPRGLQPKGRLYVGPQGSTGATRPTTVRQEVHAGWAENLHQGFVFAGYTPKIIGKAGTTFAYGMDIAAYRVDQLWDTQRRRGFNAALAGTSVTVTV